MRASHKKRLARITAAFDATEEEAVSRRTELRFNAVLCEITNLQWSPGHGTREYW